MQHYKTWLLSYQGRITRTQFWLGLLIGVAVLLVATIIIALTFFIEAPVLFYILMLPYIVIFCAVIWSQIVLAIKRLHDLDKSGWMQLINYIPIIGLFFFFYMGLMPAKPGPNRFGANPKEV